MADRLLDELDEVVADLEVARATVARLEARRRGLFVAARGAGTSWAELARRARVSPQAVRSAVGL